jgi:hypothetical protein
VNLQKAFRTFLAFFRFRRNSSRSTPLAEGRINALRSAGGYVPVQGRRENRNDQKYGRMDECRKAEWTPAATAAMNK